MSVNLALNSQRWGLTSSINMKSSWLSRVLSHGDARQRGNYAATQLYFSFATILLSWQSVFTIIYQFVSHHLKGHFKHKALQTQCWGYEYTYILIYVVYIYILISIYTYIYINTSINILYIYTDINIYISPYISHIYGPRIQVPQMATDHIQSYPHRPVTSPISSPSASKTVLELVQLFRFPCEFG